jgi:prepilin peptidase dependent protein B
MRARHQHGFSMVELLVSVALGLFVTAAATTLLVGNLRENRQLLQEARLMQELRASADMVARDVRRAGHWAAAGQGVWTPGSADVPVANPYAGVENPSAAEVSFQYQTAARSSAEVQSNERLGFRLRSGVLQVQLGQGNWQALTDANTLRITQFSLTPQVQTLDLARFCPQLALRHNSKFAVLRWR